jgi:hypothetical protein
MRSPLLVRGMTAKVSLRLFDDDFGIADEEDSVELEDEGSGVRFDFILDDFVDSLLEVALLVGLLLRDDATLGSGSNNVSLTSSRVRMLGGVAIVVVSLRGCSSDNMPLRRHTSYTRSNCLASTTFALCAFSADSSSLWLVGDSCVCSFPLLHDDDRAGIE